ncbi:MAG: HAD-IB family hydrolase [Deltaproteobacteria bacterium]|nr:HAD-IB family hydrolase [Deltaproteobacteria bacterium]
MDRTVLSVETGPSWARFLYSRGELPVTLMAKVAYWTLLHRFALLDVEDVFARTIWMLRGNNEAEMVAKSDIWYREHIAPTVVPAARVAVEHHRNAGHMIVLATGSTQYAARAVARNIGIDHVLSSELEVANGTFTGRSTAMGFGPHKVAQAEQWAQHHGVDLEQSYFYSDSYTDLPMFERVGTAIAVNPDTRLYRHARARGWRVRYWS